MMAESSLQLNNNDGVENSTPFCGDEERFLDITLKRKIKNYARSKRSFKRFCYLFIKRLFDIVMSLVAICLLIVPYILISLLILIVDRHPPIYTQKRVGLKGKTFRIIKFRSMHTNAEQQLEILKKENSNYFTEFKFDNDPRITKLGKFIRKTSIDELPQFINVLLGQMSLVGPRPVLEDELKLYTEADVIKVLCCKPGVTGYWQAYSRNNVTYKDYKRQSMEVYYADNCSILLDLKICFKTVEMVLTKKGAK